MITRVDLRGLNVAGRHRRARVYAELAALAEAVPGDRLEVLAADEDAFAARLVVAAGTRVARDPLPRQAAIVYRPVGEAGPAACDDAPTLAEPLDLGRLADAEQGPADADRILDARLEGMARSPSVRWRIAAGWQAGILRERLGVAADRILWLPAEARLPPGGRLASARLPPGLPDRYLLCLTPVGAGGDVAGLIAAHARLGRAAAALVVLGVDDEGWLPPVRRAVETAGSRGRVMILRDLDPVAQVAAIARAAAVVAIARHPAHAIRLRQAAALGRPAVLRRHPGHAAWVVGGRWFEVAGEELVEGLAAPLPIGPPATPATADQAAAGLPAWLTAQRPDAAAPCRAGSDSNSAS